MTRPLLLSLVFVAFGSLVEAAPPVVPTTFTVSNEIDAACEAAHQVLLPQLEKDGFAKTSESCLITTWEQHHGMRWTGTRVRYSLIKDPKGTKVTVTATEQKAFYYIDRPPAWGNPSDLPKTATAAAEELKKGTFHTTVIPPQ